MNTGVVIYSPPGCGKSQHKDELAAIFGKNQIIDNWVPGDNLPENALALTNVLKVKNMHSDAIAKERERCAKLCEEFAKYFTTAELAKTPHNKLCASLIRETYDNSY